MCGIIGVVAPARADQFLLPALTALEYRGYDSVGVAVRTLGDTVARLRSTSRVVELGQQVDRWAGAPLSGTGIGHTRWATHGGVTEQNAHPHSDCAGLVSVVHNGIIENSEVLRTALIADGHSFSSEVDSEVICHLLEQRLSLGDDLVDALAATVERLEGSWAIVVMHNATGRIVATTRRAPLLIAVSAAGSFVASDISAFAPWVDHFHVMASGDVVELAGLPIWMRDGTIVDAPDAVLMPRRILTVDGEKPPVLVGDFMGREIAEQPETAERILADLADSAADGSLWFETGLPSFDRVAIVGCGTSLNAARVIATAFSQYGRMPAITVTASEASGIVLEPRTLIIAVSQSGETADVLRALEVLESPDCPVLALSNNTHSTLARSSDATINCLAGPEIGVAATKTFIAQVLTGVCIAVSALVAMGRLPRSRALAVIGDLRRTPERLEYALDVSEALVPEIVPTLLDARGFLFLGRGSGVVYAAEGALKLKELTYLWAEHYAAGELKHGPLALVEQGTPVFVVDNDDPRLAGNISEVRARGGRVIRIGGAGSTLPVVAGLPGLNGLTELAGLAGGDPFSFAPCGPLESIIPMQVLARQLALALGRDVDKPRNLAKSVTVD